MTTTNKIDATTETTITVEDDNNNALPQCGTTTDIVTLDSNVTGHIVSLVATEELLSTQREALRALTSEEIKTLDDSRKDNREQLANVMRTQLTIEQSVTVCNELLAPLNGGDDAERKRAQRRRNFFRRILTDSFPSYDSEVSKGRKGGLIKVHFVGDEHDRKAVKLVETYRELAKYISELPQINTKVVATLLRKGEPQQKGILDMVPASLVSGAVTGNTDAVLSTLAEKIARMQDVVEEQQAI